MTRPATPSSSGKKRPAPPEAYRPRTYRDGLVPEHRAVFRVTVKETDLHIQADRNLEAEARESTLAHRAVIESYIRQYPEFAHTLTPWRPEEPVPRLVAAMISAGNAAGVGPMAAVAGAVAEAVGRDLLALSGEVVVENGGDIFLKCRRPPVVAVFAGESPLSLKVGVRIDAPDRSVSVCTSSGTIGHSLSLGRADAACVVADDAALADAAATALGNLVKRPGDIPAALESIAMIPGVRALLVIMADRMGAWGDLEIVPLGTVRTGRLSAY